MANNPRTANRAGDGNAYPDVGILPPKKGDKFRCDNCGMALEVTVDCKCDEDDHVHFHCCGQEMQKV